MIRLFCIMMLGAYSPIMASATTISYPQVARDLGELITMRDSIASLQQTGSTYTRFVTHYRSQLSVMQSRYAHIARTALLEPTFDRTLRYTLTIQDYPLSCEITALRIVLRALGTSRTEPEIIKAIPHAPAPYSPPGMWGDPDTHFVGSYVGTQAKKTGYGVYEAPLARYAESFGYTTTTINRMGYQRGYTPHKHLVSLLKVLNDSDRHVILWGDWCTVDTEDDGILPKGGKILLGLFPLPAKNTCTYTLANRTIVWTTPAGKVVRGLSGEHAFVLLGYIGPVEDPTHLIVWDTFSGRHIFSYSEWMRKWNLVDNRSLIISK